MQVQILKNKYIYCYSVVLALGLCLLKWLESRFLIISHSFELYTGGIALVFTVLGIWLARQLVRPKIETITIEREVTQQVPTEMGLAKDALLQLGISAREFEVLLLMADGLSNQEIADRLYISLNTIKTHSSRIFEKLEVKRRTQAVDKARNLGRA